MARLAGVGGVAVVALLLLSSFAALGIASAPLPGAATTVPATTAFSAVAPSVSPSSASASPVSGTGNPAASAAAYALSAAASHGVKPSVVFVPRPSATSSQIAATLAGAPVTPLYTGSPAPMGLAYYGVSADAGNVPTSTVLNTTRVMASVDANATGIRALDLVQSSPDSYGIQLNAVTTGVTLFGHRGYSFWTQNVVLFYPDAHQMILVSNVWNFTAAPGLISPNAILYNGAPGGNSDGPNGTNNYGSLGFYYGESVINTPISYPFNLTLYLNSTVVDHRNAVSFGIQLTGPGEHFGSSAWDYVVFNSVRPAGALVTAASNYTADGRSYNRMGLTNDFELTFGGPGGGSQATLFAADANLGLAYYTGSSFVSVPAAYAYGGETGETATGAHLSWSNAPGGPAGLTTYGTMTTGPSFLEGLWNATTPAGSYPVTIAATPANALSVVTNVGPPSSFFVSEAAVAPTAFSHTLYLSPGNYTVLTELTGYTAQLTPIDVTGPTTVPATLASNPSSGVYTPLWAFSNPEVAALSVSGSGTAASPYVMPSSQPAALNATWGLYNDFGFPVYPAVLFYATSVPAEFLHPPSFATSTNRFASPGGGLPATNDPPYWFWNVSNVSVVGAANISGWFVQGAYSPLGFNTFSMVFYASTHDLVAANNFTSEAGGLLLYSSGSFLGPSPPTVGGNNTVWGNHFREVPSPSSSVALTSVAEGLGIEVAEPFDLLYNNWVATPTTAWQLPINLYSGATATFPVRWNITRSPATDVHYAAGFPFEPLTGSIAGTAYQGGNLWWDYGNSYNPYNGANDPYGELPYTEAAQTPIEAIFGPGYYSDSYLWPGGDYVPLSSVVLYSVTVTTSPVTNNSSWGIDVWSPQHPFANTSETGPEQVVYLPNGTYWYRGAGSTNFTFTGPRNTTLTVAGANLTVLLKFRVPRGDHSVIFTESGLPRGTRWGVEVNGSASLLTVSSSAAANSTAARIVFGVYPGNYTYAVLVRPPQYVPNHPSGWVNVSRASGAVHLHFTAVFYTTTISESGLPNASAWAVTISGKTHGGSVATLSVPLVNGSYALAVRPKAGYTVNFAPTFVVNGGPVSVSVTFTRVLYSVTFEESGLANGTSWAVKLAGITHTAVAPATVVFAEPNGSFGYSVVAVTGFHAAPSTGTVHVAAAGVVVAVTFTPTAPQFAAPTTSAAPLAAVRS